MVADYDPSPRPGHDSRDAAKPAPRASTLTLPGTLTTARLKVTTILNAAELLAIKSPKDRPRITLRIRLPDRTIAAEIAAKSLRKAQATIPEAGADNIALALQGRLIAGDMIVEAGLSAQLKAAKPAPRRPAAENDHGVGA
jgi:hypothetical protein